MVKTWSLDLSNIMRTYNANTYRYNAHICRHDDITQLKQPEATIINVN